MTFKIFLQQVTPILLHVTTFFSHSHPPPPHTRLVSCVCFSFCPSFLSLHTPPPHPAPRVRASLTVGVLRYWGINMLLQSSRVSSVRSKSVHKGVYCYWGMLKCAVVTQQGWGRWKGGIKGLLKYSSMQSRYEVYQQNKIEKGFLKNIQGIISSDRLLSCSGGLLKGSQMISLGLRDF